MSDYTLEQIYAAFRKVFYGAGDIFFPGDWHPEDAESEVDYYFEDFLGALTKPQVLEGVKLPEPYATYDMITIKWYHELLDIPMRELCKQYPDYTKNVITQKELAMEIIRHHCP